MMGNMHVVSGILQREAPEAVASRAAEIFAAICRKGLEASAWWTLMPNGTAIVCLRILSPGEHRSYPVELRIYEGRATVRFRESHKVYFKGSPDEMADRIKAMFQAWLDAGGPFLEDFGKAAFKRSAKARDDLREKARAAQEDSREQA